MDMSVLFIIKETQNMYDIIVVSNSSLDVALNSLAEKVNEKCAEKWQTCGDIIISPVTDYTGQFIVVQAIEKDQCIHLDNHKFQFDVQICDKSLETAIKSIASYINEKCKHGWRIKGEVVISPIKDHDRFVVAHAMMH